MKRWFCRLLCKLGAHTSPVKVVMGARETSYTGPIVYRIVCGQCGACLATGSDERPPDVSRLQ